MQRTDFVHRGLRKPDRWMYVPEYRARREIDWKGLARDVMLGVCLGGAMTLGILMIMGAV